MSQQKQDTSVPINQFVVYEVTIREAQQTILNPSIEPQTALANAKQIFGSCFSGKRLELVRYAKENGEVEASYPNDILSSHDGVYLLRINNIKQKSLVKPGDTTTNGFQDYNEIKEESNPYCYVVIDNREGWIQIAIQKNSAWGDPNNVRRLLVINLNKHFLREGIPLEVSIDAKMRQSEIWEFCDGQCNKNGDVIQSISFVFPNQTKIAQENRIKDPKGYIRELARLMKMTDAIKTSICLNYSSADPKKIEENAKDLAYIVRACQNTSYNLEVRFRDYGKYKCDDMVRAMFPMDESLIHAFWVTNWQELNYKENTDSPIFGLVKWCDLVNEQSKLFTNAERIPAKRRRTNPR